MRRFIVGLRLKLYALFESIEKSKGFHIGDNVIDTLNNKKCTIIDMTKCTGDTPPIPLATLIDDKRTMYNLPYTDLKKCKDWHTIKNSLLYHYRWYMAAWYGIRLNEELNEKR